MTKVAVQIRKTFHLCIITKRSEHIMKVEQIYTGCLAQGAYYITSMGEAAIIDPLREITPYIERLKRDGVRLKYILETHFHADFVSGHLDLSHATGAPIIYGPTAKAGFDAIVAEDGQTFELGKAKIKVIHTPGHTMESSCFLLIDEEGHETALFSGDTLFLGDVGRPDLAQKAANLTQEELAGKDTTTLGRHRGLSRSCCGFGLCIEHDAGNRGQPWQPEACELCPQAT